MTADINIGDNYELDEDSNGNLVIRDSTGNTVLEHTDGGAWDVLRPIGDEEYRVVDSNRNIVGTLFAESDGTLTLQEGTSGNGNEVSLDTDGAVESEQYRLVDSNENAVGSLFAEPDGTLKLQEGTSGNENVMALGTDGTLKLQEGTSGNENVMALGTDGTLAVETADINQSGCRVHPTANFSVPSDIPTTFEFDADRYIDSGVVTVDNTNNTISVNVSGRFRVEIQATYLGDLEDNICTATVNVNGNKRTTLRGIRVSATRDAAVGSDEIDLSANDTIDITLSQVSGTSVDVAGDASSTYVIVRKVA